MVNLTAFTLRQTVPRVMTERRQQYSSGHPEKVPYVQPVSGRLSLYIKIPVRTRSTDFTSEMVKDFFSNSSFIGYFTYQNGFGKEIYSCFYRSLSFSGSSALLPCFPSTLLGFLSSGSNFSVKGTQHVLLVRRQNCYFGVFFFSWGRDVDSWESSSFPSL